MILRTLNEFVRENTVLALEPSRTCECACTYCFAHLNSKSQYAARSKSMDDDGSFERTLEKAHSAAYDPTDFLQWSLANNLALGWANTTEPFQDIKQARSCLQVCNNFDLPLFLQTKCLNFDAVSDLLAPVIDNTAFFVSLPSLDQRVVKRFEPGTPSICDRLKAIEWLRARDAWVIAALSPYHEDWCEDPGKLIDDLTDLGVNEIFLDRLHLSARQYAAAADPVMAALAGGRKKPLPSKYIDHLEIIHQAAIENDLEIVINGFDGVVYGLYNTLPTISPDEVFSRGMAWIYHDGLVFQALQESFYDEEAGITPISRDPSDSVLLTWPEALRLIHMAGEPIEQEFSWRSLYDVIPIGRKLPDAWQAILKPKATMPEYFRALWNVPYENAFIWRHPWISVAAKSDGTPWTDEDGNLVGLFDPDYLDRHKRMFRKVESLEPFRRLEIAFTPEGPQEGESDAEEG